MIQNRGQGLLIEEPEAAVALSSSPGIVVSPLPQGPPMISANQLVSTGMLAIAAVIGFSAPVGAQSIRQRAATSQDRQQAAEAIAGANKTCGSHVALTVDWNSFADAASSPENTNQQSAWAFVENATDAMDAACRSSAEGKATITSDLHTIMVRHTSAEEMSYSGGVLHYGVPYHGAGYTKLEAYLLDNVGGGAGHIAGGGGGGGATPQSGDPMKSAVDALRNKLRLPN